MTPERADAPEPGRRPPGVPAHYPYPDVPLTRLLDDAAQDFPANEALAHRGHALTYRELADQVDRLAAGLRDLGLGAGDRIALLLPACPQHVIAVLAAARLGASVVLLPPDAPPASVAHAVTDTGCRALVCTDEAYETVSGLKGRLPTVTHLLTTDLSAYAGFPRNLAARLPKRQVRRDGLVRFKDLIRQSAPRVGQAPLDSRRGLLAVVGTWGAGALHDLTPASSWDRGVALTHANVVAASFQVRLWIPDVQAGSERLLVAAAPEGGFGLAGLGTSLLAAASIGTVAAPEAGRISAEVERHRATIVLGAAGTLAGLAMKRADLGSLRVALADGPVRAEDAERVQAAAGARLRGGLGLPEAAGLVLADAVYGRAKGGSAGLPLPDTDVVVAETAGSAPAPAGQSGWLRVRGPQLMRGYWARPDETRAVVADGWLRTGLRATRDRDGVVWLDDPRTGR